MRALPLDDAGRSAEPPPALLADKRVEPVESEAASRERGGDVKLHNYCAMEKDALPCKSSWPGGENVTATILTFRMQYGGAVVGNAM
jgi:hypothetical protein